MTRLVEFERVRKPDTTTAMRVLMAQMHTALPFDVPTAQVCSGNCQGCSLKLLEFLAAELESWEQRLAAGEQPTLADLSQLASSGWKIYRVLQRNGVVASTGVSEALADPLK